MILRNRRQKYTVEYGSVLLLTVNDISITNIEEINRCLMNRKNFTSSTSNSNSSCNNDDNAATTVRVILPEQAFLREKNEMWNRLLLKIL